MMRMLRGVPERKALLGSYKSTYAANKALKKSKGWEQLLDLYLPEKKLLQVHKEGLDAVRLLGPEHIEVPDHYIRKQYVELGYKLRGKLTANEQPASTVNFNFFTNEQLKRVAARVISDDVQSLPESSDRFHDSDEQKL